MVDKGLQVCNDCLIDLGFVAFRIKSSAHDRANELIYDDVCKLIASALFLRCRAEELRFVLGGDVLMDGQSLGDLDIAINDIG